MNSGIKLTAGMPIALQLQLQMAELWSGAEACKTFTSVVTTTT